MLNKNAQPAEIRRGCFFSENFESLEAINRNGGTVTGTLTYNLDGALFSGSQKVVYPQKNGVKTVSFWITLTSTTESIIKLSSSHSISVTAGTLAATGFAAPTIRVNGVATTTITTVKSFVEIDTATAITCDDIQVGHIATNGNFRMRDLKFWTNQLTLQEALDYYNNSTFNYLEKADVILPMTINTHDVMNVRTLDVSGNGAHSAFGDGSTPTTYPTKLTKRGYSFDGDDYLRGGEVDLVGASGLTMFTVVKNLPVGWSCLYSIDKVDNSVTAGFLQSYTPSGESRAAFFGGLNGWYARGDIDLNLPRTNIILVGVATGTRTSVYLNGERGVDAPTPQSLVQDAGQVSTVGGFGHLLFGTAREGTEILTAGYFSFALTDLQVHDLTLRLQKQLNTI